MTPRRLDLAVKHRFFRALLNPGKDVAAIEFYRWHIDKRSGWRMRAGVTTDNWKRTVDDYVRAATHLLDSMQRDGFHVFSPVPVDPDGELLGGAHRLACALALRIDCWAFGMPNRVFAPPWDRQWFLMMGLDERDVASFELELEMLHALTPRLQPEDDQRQHP